MLNHPTLSIFTLFSINWIEKKYHQKHDNFFHSVPIKNVLYIIIIMSFVYQHSHYFLLLPLLPPNSSSQASCYWNSSPTCSMVKQKKLKLMSSIFHSRPAFVVFCWCFCSINSSVGHDWVILLLLSGLVEQVVRLVK